MLATGIDTASDVAIELMSVVDPILPLILEFAIKVVFSGETVDPVPNANVSPSVVAVEGAAVVVKGTGIDVVDSGFTGVVISSKVSKSSALNTCLGLINDSTVIFSERPRAAA